MMQQFLALDPQPRHTDLGEGCHVDLHDALSPQAAREAMERLRVELPWWQEVYRRGAAGNVVPAPRLTSFHGDAHCRYTYSGIRYAPHPWHPVLIELRTHLVRLTQHPFNSVLCNLYRDGRDSVGYHADDEPELGPSPDNIVIASLSLGAPRRFVLKHRRTGASRVYSLGEGRLLVMRGHTQRHYVHALPKTSRQVGARINLTFRVVSPG
ncbi:MAG: alpha-ketoglutarate-dependent dioxygenase AlkB [Myxococcales bacterium]|nr:alpha-ketoglutarate-dependent dioxygenase AlkB [Myxococcales bacterium]